MNELYDYLQVNGMGDVPDVEDAIRKLPFNKVVDLSQRCVELAQHQTKLVIPQKPIFNFCVCSSLSGVNYCCSLFDCRMERIDNLSLFSAMYSERVVIPQFINPIPKNFVPVDKKHSEWIYDKLILDIAALLKFKPLIDEGIIVLNSQGITVCQECALKRNRRLLRSLYEKLRDKIQFRLDNPLELKIVQQEKYTDISIISFRKKEKKFAPYFNKVPYTFSYSESVRLNLFSKFFGELLVDVLGQQQLLQKFGLSYLTNRKLDAEFISTSSNKEAQKVNMAIFQGLSHQLPFLQGVNIHKILEIRKKDGSAFVQYRDSFRKVIKHTKKSINSSDVEEAVQDIIMPEVNRIQRLIDVNKDRLGGKTKRDLVFNSIAITVGVVGQKFLNLDTSLVNGLIGLKTVYDIYSSALDSRDVPKEAQESNYYFLWQVVNKARSIKS